MIEATFTVESWDEDPVDERSPKITRAAVTTRYQGGIEGTSRVDYVMVYGDDGTAATTALERLECTIGERSGTIVLRAVGGYADGAATGDLEVLAAYGTGDFAGVEGKGTMRADPAGTVKLDLLGV